MSRIDTRRHRRGRTDTADTTGADTVTLTSPEFIEKLRREYVDTTTQARNAQAQADRGFKDASQFEQQANDLGVKEQAIIARIQQAQTELAQVQQDRQEAAQLAERARSYGTAAVADREKFEKAAADARTVLVSFNLDVPEIADQDVPPMPGPAGPTRIDLVDDDPLTGPLARFHEAHDEQDQHDAQQAGAA